VAPTDNQVGVRYKAQTNRSLDCHVVSGSLARDITIAPGEPAALDFAKAG
jgi:hypothetical protein